MAMMKKLSFFAIFLFLLAPLSPALAIDESNIVTVGPEEVIDQDYLMTADNITISGTINGDAYVAANNVTVDGNINGDLLVAAGTLTMLGRISDDLRVVGGQALISGSIGKNLSFFGVNLSVAKNSMIANSLVAMASHADLYGRVGNNATIYAQTSVIGNEIGGDLSGTFGELQLTDRAKVSGDLNYESNNEANLSNEAIITGTTNRFFSDKTGPRSKKGKMFRNVSAPVEIAGFIISFLLGWLMIVLLPERKEKILSTFAKKPAKSLLIGALLLCFMPIMLVLLAVSLVGLPLALFLIPTFILLAYLSRILIVLYFGKRFGKRLKLPANELVALFLGLLVYYLLRMVPYLATLVLLLVTLSGLGSLILSFKSDKNK